MAPGIDCLAPFCVLGTRVHHPGISRHPVVLDIAGDGSIFAFMKLQRIAPLVALTLLAACSSNESTAPSIENDTPAYTFSITGEQKLNGSGISLTRTNAKGYGEVDPSGQLQWTPVVLITLASTDVTKPQVNLGLIGPIKPGTYALRVFGSPLGTKQEFYGSFMVPEIEGAQLNYTPTTGTVTITSVSPVIRGSFKFHSSSVVEIPAKPAPGTQLTASAASLDASGTFVSRAPDTP